MINYGKHSINQNDIAAVVDVLENQFLTQGQQGPLFEKALCHYTGAAHCTLVNSATSGLHVACMAIELGKGDILWTVPNSFAASANCARYCGAEVDFVDIDSTTRNISVVQLDNKLLQAQQNNALPKALVVVHFAGISCDMQAIRALCAPLKIAIIEDAAHSLGSQYLDKNVGNCQFSDIAVLSFHPVKSITTAEGGAIMTNNEKLAKKCQLYSKHGITRDTELMQGASEGPWYYQQLCLGYNYRLSDIHSALGLSQLSRVDEFIHKRRVIAAKYFDRLQNLPLKLPQIDNIDSASWHLYMVELTQHNRAEVYEALHANGIGVNVHYIPIHLHPYYQELGFEAGQFPVSENFYNHALTLPIYYDLSEDEQDRVISVLHDILAE
ncbi:UDP-4-amino-4,6-dideoxy-N-acetyl-beta-L-altrosamine transaminase [Glaciecola petra]|uniref:UDP-4-amino-4, 6-dideoxy-N-acetyl-beta-L-altrosamine transaminase n=1 Tax=Glaciecola petra TaxID=3075602 RepID=A0ABU2ZMF6_9ALTE|nr:UDP-4-amino-4,6-dideoxy-N-acetyl-beta-L-altrosamine transaminase [Aestuariibacter sp. P117]MDT0593803.1 UDP-4-amino-4,6-dideoxy-N-acetyl-beta-L-altrosamine transaminase [Aestuariibacter sp. P117]